MPRPPPARLLPGRGRAGRGAVGCAGRGAGQGPAAGVHRRAGRPGRRGRGDLERLADACGALLATSAAAKGLFRGSPWDLDVSGGFASPLAAELIRGADLVVGWGCSLNMWTLRHGTLIGPEATVVQVDDDPAATRRAPPGATGRDRRRGDDRAGRRSSAAAAAGSGSGLGYRLPARLRDRIAARSAGGTCRTRTRAAAAGSTRAR